MPAKPIHINLLGQSDLEHTPWGRIITWATTYGRYIMIATEVVVLLAFISRFSLDRKLTDLKEEISQKQTIIDANATFEKEVRTLQDQLAQVKTLMTDQTRPVSLLALVNKNLPPDVYIYSFNITGSKLTLDMIAGTSGGFAQFLANIGAQKEFANLAIGDTNRLTTGGIKFQITALVGTPTPKPK